MRGRAGRAREGIGCALGLDGFKLAATNAFGTGTATATIARLTLLKPKRR
jgi:hypothetical protein